MRTWLLRSAALVTAAGAALVAGAVPASSGGGDVTTLHTVLTGAAERPGPGDPDGRGAFAAVVRGDTLCYTLVAVRIEPATAAHIHIAPPTDPGPIVIGLETPDPVSHGCITAVPDDQNTTETLTESELAALLAAPGDFYVNVHNASFQPGAIRGQLR
ncbi:CHRD domain-containing protein [Jiangella sp. DSM 45060]|uniref:CHRD domain-containing protein n=1 Tax=Jiangella sp. DSM 45060 TaxID=1798224 RepID=UPI0008795748|nr:CHRD domain-containing protein [Jiangella sp. DSM 45060]SDT02239.1 CHRD domain-containing protein [Jiangella sp. DSM 45060]